MQRMQKMVTQQFPVALFYANGFFTATMRQCARIWDENPGSDTGDCQDDKCGMPLASRISHLIGKSSRLRKGRKDQREQVTVYGRMHECAHIALNRASE